MKRLTTTLAATVLAGGLLGLAPAASAVPTCADPAHPIEGWDAVDAVVGTKKVVTIDLGVQVDEGCVTESATAYLTGPRKSFRVTLHPTEPNEGHVWWRGSVRLDPRDLRNADAGTWQLRYRVEGDGVSESVTDPARVRRATRISFNAGPEPARNNRLTFSGTLERASWSSRTYKGVRKTVVVRTVDPVIDEWEEVVSIRTRKDGSFRTTVAFPGPGPYWADFGGGEVSGFSTSRIDRVDAP